MAPSDSIQSGVVVAWFTAAKGSAQVKVAFSADAGATFSAPIRIDDGTPVDFSLFDRALLALPSKLADRMKLPGGGRINEAIALLDELTHANELVDFLTLPAYERLP